MEKILSTQERVRNSRGKGAIIVRATEVLLYMGITPCIPNMIQKEDDLYQLMFASLDNEILPKVGITPAGKHLLLREIMFLSRIDSNLELVYRSYVDVYKVC